MNVENFEADRILYGSSFALLFFAYFMLSIKYPKRKANFFFAADKYACHDIFANEYQKLLISGYINLTTLS